MATKGNIVFGGGSLDFPEQQFEVVSNVGTRVFVSLWLLRVGTMPHDFLICRSYLQIF